MHAIVMARRWFIHNIELCQFSISGFVRFAQFFQCNSSLLSFLSTIKYCCNIIFFHLDSLTFDLDTQQQQQQRRQPLPFDNAWMFILSLKQLHCYIHWLSTIPSYLFTTCLDFFILVRYSCFPFSQIDPFLLESDPNYNAQLLSARNIPNNIDH